MLTTAGPFCSTRALKSGSVRPTVAGSAAADVAGAPLEVVPAACKGPMGSAVWLPTSAATTSVQAASPAEAAAILNFFGVAMENSLFWDTPLSKGSAGSSDGLTDLT